MAENLTKKSDSRSMFTLRVPTDLKWKVGELAARNRKRSLNAFIIDLLEKAVKDEKTIESA